MFLHRRPATIHQNDQGANMHTHTHTHTHTYARLYVHAHISTRRLAHIRICLHAYKHARRSSSLRRLSSADSRPTSCFTEISFCRADEPANTHALNPDFRGIGYAGPDPLSDPSREEKEATETQSCLAWPLVSRGTFGSCKESRGGKIFFVTYSWLRNSAEGLRKMNWPRPKCPVLNSPSQLQR